MRFDAKTKTWIIEDSDKKNSETYNKTYYSGDSGKKFLEETQKLQESVEERLKWASNSSDKDRRKLYSDIIKLQGRSRTVDSLGASDTSYSEYTKNLIKRYDFSNPNNYDSNMYWSYAGKSLAEIDKIIEKGTNASSFVTVNLLGSGANNKYKSADIQWLAEHRDMFMNSSEIEAEINKFDKLIAENPDDISVSLWKTRRSELVKLYANSEKANTSVGQLQQKYDETKPSILRAVLDPDYTWSDYRQDKSDSNIYATAIREKKSRSALNAVSSSKGTVVWTDINGHTVTGSVSEALQAYRDMEHYDEAGAYEYSSPTKTSKTPSDVMAGIKSAINKQFGDSEYTFEDLYEPFVEKRNSELTSEVNQFAAELAQEHPVLSNAASVVMKTVSPVFTLPKALESLTESIVSDEPTFMDTDSPEFMLENAATAIREETQKEIESGYFGEFGSFLYQTGMSIADFALAAAVSGGNATASKLIMSSTVASQSLLDASRRGMQAQDVFRWGALTAGTEYIFNTLGLDKVFDAINNKATRSFVGQVFKAMFSEGFEEVATDLTNTVIDYFANADKSDYLQTVQQYADSGYSRSQAEAMAMKDTLTNLALSFAGGALAGGVMTGVPMTVNKVAQESALKRIGANIGENTENADYLRSVARDIVAAQSETPDASSVGDSTLFEAFLGTKDVNEDTQSVKKSLASSERRNSSSRRTGKLYASVQESLSKRIDGLSYSNLRSAVSERLAAYNLDEGDADSGTRIIMNKLTDSLTRSQQREFDKSDVLQAVYRDIEDGAPWLANVKARADEQRQALENAQSTLFEGSLGSEKRQLGDLDDLTEDSDDITVENGDNTQTAVAAVPANAVVTDSGDYRIELASGEELEIKAEDVEFKREEGNTGVSPSGEAILRTASAMPNRSAAQTAVDILRLSADAVKAQSDVMTAYVNGYTGDSFKQSEYKAIDFDSARKMFNLGEKLRIDGGKVDGMNIRAVISGARLKKGVTKLSAQAELNENVERQLDVLDRYGKKYNLSFVITDTIASGSVNGYYAGDNVIAIALDSEGGALLAVAGHETYHYLEHNLDSSELADLKKFVLDKLKNPLTGYDYDAEFENLAQMLGTRDADAIESEMIANSMFNCLGEQKTLIELYKQDISLFEKVKSALEKIIAKISEIIKSVPWREAQQLKDDMSFLNELSEKFDKAVSSVSENETIERSANNRIRLSRKSTYASAAARETELKTNAELRKANDTLRRAMSVYPGQSISLNSARDFAKTYLERIKSNYSSETLAKKIFSIMSVYDAVKDKSDTAFNNMVASIARELETAINESEYIDNSLYDATIDTRRYLKRTAVRLHPETLHALDGSYGSFRSKMFGRLRIAEDSSDAPFLADIYSELVEMSPELFPAEGAVTEYDMAVSVMKFWDAVKPVISSFNFMDARTASVYMTYDLMSSYLANSIYSTATQNLSRELLKAKADKEKIAAEERMRYQNIIKRRAERQEDTRVRAKIRGSIRRRINDLSAMMYPSKKSKGFVPDQLKPAVEALIELFDGDRAIISESKLTVLQSRYSAMDLSNGPVAHYFDPDVLLMLDELIESARAYKGNVRTALLNESDSRLLGNIVDNVYNMVKNADNVFYNGRKQSFKDTVGLIMFRDMAEAKSERVQRFLDMTSFNMTPYYFFKRVGGKLNEIFSDFMTGQDKYGKMMARAHESMVKLAKEFDADKWYNDTDRSIEIDTGSIKVKLTVGEALGIYAAARREGLVADADGRNMTSGVTEHLIKGGIVFADKGKYSSRRTRKTVALSFDDIGKIIEGIDKISPKARRYADAVVKYLSTEAAAWGNETSVRLSGYQKFLEKYYYPFHVSKMHTGSSDMKTDEQTVKTEAAVSPLLKNSSFTNQLTYGASNPLVVEDFRTVAGAHIAQMINYNCFAECQSLLSSVLNYVNKKENLSVEQAVSVAYGEKAPKYIKTLISDIAGGNSYNPGEGIAKKLTRQFKQTAVALNVRVMVQQPSAIGRAMALVDPKYFFTKPVGSKYGYEELKRYSGIAVIKEIGGFDISTGSDAGAWLMKDSTPTGLRNKAREFFSPKDSDYRNHVFSYGAQLADEVTWTHIWQAVKKETAAKTHLSGEALLNAAGKRFNEVIEATQVYDSVLARSQIMRVKTVWAQSATAFMSEPTKRINMLTDAAYRLLDNPGKESKKYFAGVVGSILVSAFLNTVLKSVPTAMRDDDENKNFAEKIVNALISESISDISLLQGLPIIKDIISVFQGYDVTRTDMEMISSLVNSFSALNKAIQSGDGFTDALLKAFSTALTFFGIPATNLYREITAIVNTTASIFGEETPPVTAQRLKNSALESFVGLFDFAWGNPFEGLLPDSGDVIDTILKHEGETDAEQYINDAMDELMLYYQYNGKSDPEQTVLTGMKNEIKSRLLDGDMSEEKAIELLETYCGVENAFWMIQEWQYKAENPDSDYDKYAALTSAVAESFSDGRIKNAEKVKEEINNLLSHGISDVTVKNKITSCIRSEFEQGNLTEAQAQDLLIAYTELGDEYDLYSMSFDDETDAKRKTYEWRVKAEQGEDEEYSVYGALHSAIDSGSDIPDSAWDELTELDYTTDQIYSAINTHIKDNFDSGEYTFTEAVSALKRYSNFESDADARNKVTVWQFKNENPDSEIKDSETAVLNYVEAKDYGITLTVFEDYYARRKECKGQKDSSGKTVSGSVKAQALLVIDSLPLSSSQKDVLYFQNGWAESTLSDAPWH